MRSPARLAASMLVRTAAEPFMAMLAESSSEEDED